MPLLSSSVHILRDLDGAFSYGYLVSRCSSSRLRSGIFDIARNDLPGETEEERTTVEQPCAASKREGGRKIYSVAYEYPSDIFIL